MSWPIDSTGPESTAAVAKYAASAPTVRSPWATSHTPSARPTPSTASGSATIRAMNPESTDALRTSVPRSVSARPRKPSSACAPRPNAFRTRMPCTDSSTVVARSPAWSWERREAERKSLRNPKERHMIGTAAARYSSASCQDSPKSRAMPTRMVTALTTSITEPNAIHRRSRDRSAWARESS